MVDPRFPLTHRVPLYSLGLDLSLHLLHHPTCDLPVVVACSHVGVVCHCLSGPTHRRPRVLVRNAECVRHLPLLEARWVQFRNLSAPPPEIWFDSPSSSALLPFGHTVPYRTRSHHRLTQPFL